MFGQFLSTNSNDVVYDDNISTVRLVYSRMKTLNSPERLNVRYEILSAVRLSRFNVRLF